MDVPVMMRLLQLAVKLQQVMHELSILMRDYPDLCEKLDADTVGGADGAALV